MTTITRYLTAVFNNLTRKARAANIVSPIMVLTVVNSAFVLRSGIYVKLNSSGVIYILYLNSPVRQSLKPLGARL